MNEFKGSGDSSLKYKIMKKGFWKKNPSKFSYLMCKKNCTVNIKSKQFFCAAFKPK